MESDSRVINGFHGRVGAFMVAAEHLGMTGKLPTDRSSVM